MRLRQSAIAWIGMMYMALPALVILFFPAYQLLEAASAEDEAWWWFVLSAFSWCLVLLQKETLQVVDVERYLDSLAISQGMRVAHDLLLVVIANHLFWLFCLPAVAFFIVSHGVTWALLKLAALMALLPLSQVLLVRRRQIPWLVLLLTGGAVLILLLARQWIEFDAIYAALLCLPIALLFACLNPSFTVPRTPRRRWRGARLVIGRRAPWIVLYMLIFSRSGSGPTGLRLVAAVLLAGMTHRVGIVLFAEYQVLWLMLMLFAIHYLINGLAFTLFDAHRQADLLVRSWPVSDRWTLTRDAAAVAVFQICFASLVIVSGWILDYLPGEVWLFCSAFSLVYAPLLFVLATVSPKNVLSYSTLSLLPCFVLVLVLFVRDSGG